MIFLSAFVFSILLRYFQIVLVCVYECCNSVSICMVLVFSVTLAKLLAERERERDAKLLAGKRERGTCQALISSHLSLNREGCWGTTDDFATSFLHFSLFSTALWDLANSRPVHSMILSSHLFLCLPCLLPPFTVPYKIVLARPDERET